MARAATTTDVFNAIAEPRRREIVDLLAAGEQPVGTLVTRMGIPQPAVSKHLAVLREVGIVSVTRRGRSRLYQLKARELKPVHDWVNKYEKFWSDQLNRIKAAAERKERERGGPATGKP